MGYYVHGSGKIVFKANRIPEMIEAINNGLTFTNADDKEVSLLDYFGMNSVSEDSLDVMLTSLYFDWWPDHGDIIIDSYNCDNYHSDDVMAIAALTEYMQQPAYMTFSDDLGAFWKWTFGTQFENNCSYEDGMIVFPSDGMGHVSNPEDLSGANWIQSDNIPLVEVDNSYIYGDVVNDPVLEEDGDIWGAICIDGWYKDEEQGTVLATVIMTKHGDLLVNFHNNGVRLNEMVKKSIQEAKDLLRKYWAEKEQA